MGTVTERERERERENREIYPRSLIQTIFHEKKKKEEIESGRSLSNPFQPFILVTFDRRSFQDFHFDFVPFLFHFVIRLEIDRIFSVHSLFSSSLSLSLSPSPPSFRPLLIIRPNGIRFLPSKILLGRSCYLVSSSHFVILAPRFPTLPTNGGTVFEDGIIVVEQRTFCALSRLSEVEGGRGGISRNFFSPHSYSLHVIREYFCRANVYPSNILNYSKFCIEEEGI